MSSRIEHICGCKRRHSTKELAEEHMKTANKEINLYNVYQCPECHFWHVGHKRGINKGWDKK